MVCIFRQVGPMQQMSALFGPNSVGSSLFFTFCYLIKLTSVLLVFILYSMKHYSH